MADAMDALTAAGLPVVGLSGPYTAEAMLAHVAADVCRWHEVASAWWRADLSREVDDAEDDFIGSLLEIHL